MMNEDLKCWYFMNEACKYLGMTRNAFLTWIENSCMSCVKIGRIKNSGIDEWMRSGEPKGSEDTYNG